MSQAATEIEPSAAEPTAKLQGWLSQRASLTSELAVLSASISKLRALAHVEGAVRQEIDDMTRADAVALTAWASGGCVDEQPASDPILRRSLAERLSAAVAAAAASVGSIQDLDHQIRELNEQLFTVSEIIEAVIIDVMLAEFNHFHDLHSAAMAEGSKLAAKIHGLRNYFATTGRTLKDRGQPDAGKFFARAEALSGIKIKQPDVSQSEIISAGEAWARRAAALRKGG